MTFPVIQRELKLVCRSKKTYCLRLVVVLVGILVFLLNAESYGIEDSGVLLLQRMQLILFGYCSIEGIRATSDCLSDEQRNGTLGLLFLTPLRGWDVIFQKLLSAALNSLYVFLGLIPLSGLALLLGGVTIHQFLTSNLLLIGYLFLCLSCGVFASSRSMSEMKAGMSAGALILIIWYLPLYIADFSDARIIIQFSPLWMIRGDFYWNPNGESVGIPARLVFLVGLSVIMLGAAGWRIQKLRSTLSAKTSARLTKKSLEARMIVTKKVRHECLERDPLKYLILRHRKTGIIACVVGGFHLFVFVPSSIGRSYTSMEQILSVSIACLTFILALMVLRTLLFYNTLRQSGTLELLMTTPLAARNFLKGTENALGRIFLVPILMIGTGMIASILFVSRRAYSAYDSISDWDSGGLLILALIYVIYYGSCKALAMHFGLMERKMANALAKFLCLVLVLPGSYLFFFGNQDRDLFKSELFVVFLWQILLGVWGAINVRRNLDNWAEVENKHHSRKWFGFYRPATAKA